MQICSSIFSNFHFKSRKGSIKNADDFVRKVNLNIPTFSTTYANTYWYSLDPNKKSENYKKFARVVWPKIDICREEYNKENEKFQKIIQILKSSKKLKTANCFEKSSITLCSLYANGFTDSVEASVGIKVSAIDKRTGDSVFKTYSFLDHSVIMFVPEKTKNVGDVIIIDSWLNKAMSISEAIEVYKSFLTRKEIIDKIDKFKTAFIEKNKIDYGIFGKKLPIDFDIPNYEFKISTDFIIIKDELYIEKSEDREKLGKIISKEFPELLFYNN